MNPSDVLKKAKDWGPVLFALGFLAPLVAQTLDAMDAPELLGLSHLHFGLASMILFGLVAKKRGSWV